MPRTGTPRVLEGLSTIELIEHFETILTSSDINMDATPGFPLMNYGQDVREVIKKLGARPLAEVATARFLLLDSIPLRYMEELPAFERVLLGITGMKRVFVKNEPHTKLKIRQKRERMIWNCCFIDQIIERSLLSPQYAAEKAVYLQIPATNGLSNSDEGIALLAEKLARIKDPMSTDISGYDNSIENFMFRAESRRLQKSLGLARFDNPVTKIFDNLSCSAAVIPDGSVYTQQRKGIIKSGSYTTSQSGSSQRAQYSMLAFEDKAEEVSTHGDDCVESTRGFNHEEVIAKYRKYGLGIKEIQSSDCLEFCGLSRTGPAIFLKPYKALTNFFQEIERDADGGRERRATLFYELRNHPRLEEFRKLVDEVLA